MGLVVYLRLFVCFLKKAHIGINFSVRTAFAASHRFCVVVFFIVICLKIFLNLLFDFIIDSVVSEVSERLQRKYRDFACIQPHPVSPIINILYLYGTFVKINKPIFIHCY